MASVFFFLSHLAVMTNKAESLGNFRKGQEAVGWDSWMLPMHDLCNCRECFP